MPDSGVSVCVGVDALVELEVDVEELFCQEMQSNDPVSVVRGTERPITHGS
jgi:hypothetical protein